MGNVRNITQERAAQRFHQIAVLERQVARTHQELVAAQDEVKDLRKAYESLVDRLRTAARDEGELPLFDLDGGSE